MKLRIVLRAEAQAEFGEAFDSYEAERSGLGIGFAKRLDEVFDRIADAPESYPIVFADIRKVVVSRFPYCVFFRSEPSQLQVIAVFHSSRDPHIWQHRAKTTSD